MTRSFRVRSGIGLDAGEAVPVERGYRGAALNLAARLCARAGAGEILASQEITHLAGRVEGVRYVDEGRARLKSLPGAVEIVRIVREHTSPAESAQPSRSGAREVRPGELSAGAASLYGRDVEIARIGALLESAHQGVSSALVIRGSLGTGKTSLLQHAAAGAVDIRRIEVAAVESESEFAYAGLHALINPLRAHLDDISEDHAKALRGALALDEAAVAGRLYIGAAMLALLGAAATERPLLCTLDDAHWLDPASGDALRFAARRLEAEGVVLLFAARDVSTQPFRTDGLASIELRGLREPEALRLLEERFGDAISPSVAASLARATGGNPRALVEAPLLLSERQLAGTEPIVGPLPVSEIHEQGDRTPAGPVVGRRRTRLAGGCRRGHAHDACGFSDGRVDRGRPRGVRGGWARRARSPVISYSPTPLVRSAAYQSASAAARRAAHAALARALEGIPRRGSDAPGTSPHRRSDRMSRSRRNSSPPRPWSRTGAGTQRRRRCSRTPPGFRRTALLGTIGCTWRPAPGGMPAIPVLADRALTQAEATDDPLLLADLRLLRGRKELAAGADERTAHALVDAANEIELIDAKRAAALLSAAVDALPDAAAAAHAARAVDLSNGAGGKTEVVARLAAARRVATHMETTKHLERVEEILANDRSTATDPEVIFALASSLPEASLETEDLVRRLMADSIDIARRFSVVALPHALLRAGRLELIEGRWTDASVRFDEALRLFEETGQGRFVPPARAESAYLEALRGREETCRETLRLLADSVGDDTLKATEGAVLGALELGLGRSMDAAGHLVAWAETREFSLLTPRWTPVDHVEALVRTSDREAASRAAEELAHDIDPTLRPWVDAMITAKSDDSGDLHARARGSRSDRRPAIPARADPAERRRAATKAGTPRGLERTPAGGRGAVRSDRSGRLGRACTPGASSKWREATEADRRHPGQPHAPGTPGRPDRRRRSDLQGGGGDALPQSEDDRVPPRQGLPEARHLIEA